jgi:hypothetical protein
MINKCEPPAPGANFLWILVTTEPNWAVTGDAERTQDRQTVGLGVLGAPVEMYNPHCFFILFIYSAAFLYFFKALFLYSSLKPCFTIL